MRQTRFAAPLAAAIAFALPAFAQDEMPTIRAAVLEIGTVNWELATITENNLDEKHGFELEVQPFADNGATRVAVEGDAAPGAQILSNDKAVGTLHSRAGDRAIAWLRFDRAEGEMRAGEARVIRID